MTGLVAAAGPAQDPERFPAQCHEAALDAAMFAAQEGHPLPAPRRSWIVEAVRAFCQFALDRLTNKRAEKLMAQHLEQHHQHRTRFVGELDTRGWGKRTVGVDKEAVPAFEAKRGIYEVTRAELVAIENYLTSRKAHAVIRSHSIDSLTIRVKVDPRDGDPQDEGRRA